MNTLELIRDRKLNELLEYYSLKDLQNSLSFEGGSNEYPILLLLAKDYCSARVVATGNICHLVNSLFNGDSSSIRIVNMLLEQQHSVQEHELLIWLKNDLLEANIKLFAKSYSSVRLEKCREYFQCNDSELAVLFQKYGWYVDGSYCIPNQSVATHAGRPNLQHVFDLAKFVVDLK